MDRTAGMRKAVEKSEGEKEIGFSRLKTEFEGIRVLNKYKRSEKCKMKHKKQKNKTKQKRLNPIMKHVQ